MVQFEEELQQKNTAALRIKEQEDLAQMLSVKYGLPYTDLTLVPVNIDALKEVSEADARAAKIAPFRVVGKVLHIATVSPKDPETLHALKELENRGFKTSLHIASERSLNEAWKYYKDVSLSVETSGGILEISHEKIRGYLEKIKTTEDVIKIVDEVLQSKQKYQTTQLLELLIASALATDASDIHVEPKEDAVEVRFRLDGVLHKLLSLEHAVSKLVVSRIKLLSGMKLNIKDAAQDGRFSIKLEGADVEIRSSAIPGAYGESIVLRILNPKAIRVSFENLGIEPYLLGLIEKEVEKPNGMVVNTGPTGSGKTTTLYAFLKKLHTPEVKIVTIEDPVEYHLPGVTQTQVDTESGYTFANGLRSVLRQDPDVIMVGEIRDNDTAETAIQAALTGHMVLSTLHTNDAAGALPRFVDLGVNPKIIGSALNVVLAQRLVRKLCEACKKQEKSTDEERALFESVVATLPERYKNEVAGTDFSLTWHAGGGCAKCGTIGYKGRIGVFEAIIMNAEIEKLIQANPSAREIRGVADAQGLLTLKQDGVLKVLKGVTTLAELARVVGS
ncbi:MAG: type II/IV secretion system protein [Parcubacteria group bacterium]|nr:type II/IV secretion system protein [Parcubacteria group bacterium]